MEILKIDTEKRRLGTFGEKRAVRYLRRNGYRILKKNFVADTNEIDVIARDKEATVFVEVKTRTLGNENPNEPRPASSVNAKKQRAIINAARVYAAYNPTKTKKRFDVIEVYVNQINGRYKLAEIKHLKNAFNLNTAYEHTERN